MAESAEPTPVVGRTIEVKPGLKIEGFAPSFVPAKTAWNNMGLPNLEAWSDHSVSVLNASMNPGRFSQRKTPLCEHGFITAVRVAFAHHVPLQFGPEDVWTMIIQSVSKHIEKNAEQLRDKFVDFDGKQKLLVIRNEFTKGNPNNDWAGCFEEFSSLIESFVGTENKANLCPKFSTETPISKAVSELALMDCMKSYFDYRVRTRCGISKVQLTGTPDDWRKLCKATEALRELNLGWWVDILMPILDNLAAAASGEAVMDNFWQLIYKDWDLHASGSHPTVDGWITNFFLYINDEARDKGSFRPLSVLQKESTEADNDFMWHSPGVPQKAVPVGVTQTPFVWEYHGTEIPMTFYGGFVGSKMSGEFVTPVLGWAVGQQAK